MKLACYTSTRPGVQGVFNRLIRWRYQGRVSHCEIVFEPGDGVDSDMPDGTCQPAADGALWCASSVAWERLPAWSMYRPGKRGGVRFKRITLDPARWDVIPVAGSAAAAASWAADHQGEPYSWRLVAQAIAWLVTVATGAVQWVCSQACAAMLGYAQPWRFDPCVLYVTARNSTPTR